MPYELVKNPNSNSKLIWISLIIFFVISIILNFTNIRSTIKKLLNRRKKEHFSKNSKDSKNSKNSKNSKDSKVSKDSKDSKDSKVSKKVLIKRNKSNIQETQNTYSLGVCSKQCCATGWPVPINLKERSGVNQSDVGTKYSTSNLTCNNGVMNTGCVCLTKGGKKALGNRGYIKDVPSGNGLLSQDHRVSALTLLEDQIPRPFNQILPGTDLVGSRTTSIDNVSGHFNNKYDVRLDKMRNVPSAQEIRKLPLQIPINSNTITFDYEDIDESRLEPNRPSYDNDQIIKHPIGLDDKNINVARF